MSMCLAERQIPRRPGRSEIHSRARAIDIHKIMWQSTLNYVTKNDMPYADFLVVLGKAGLSIRAFAELVGMNPNSISNYARTGELPTHLALIAVLIAGMSDLGGDYRQIMSKVALTPKKARGGARKGHFGGDRQSSLDLVR